MENTYPANTYKRIFAYYIDQFFALLIYSPVILQLFWNYIDQGALEVDYRWVVLCFFVHFCYHWFFLGMLGGTVGKLIFGLRVINVDRQKELTGFQAFLRVLTDQLSLFFGPAFKVLALLRFDRRQLADWVAETQVVQMEPRDRPAIRRPATALLLFLYFVVFDFLWTYQFFQNTEWNKGHVKIHSVSIDEELPYFD